MQLQQSLIYRHGRRLSDELLKVFSGESIMIKFFFSFCLVLGLLFSSPTLARETSALTLETFQMMQSELRMSGSLIFESAAIRYNQQVDQNYTQVPREHRPYITGFHIASMIDDLMKKYRAGDQAGALDFMAILDVKVPQNEKVTFIEDITRIYLGMPGQQ